MQSYYAFLIIGVTAVIPLISGMPQGQPPGAFADLIKNQLVESSCGTPPSSSCAAQVGNCIEFLQIDLTSLGGLEAPDFNKICANSKSLLDCTSKISTCSEIIGSANGPSPIPDEPSNPGSPEPGMEEPSGVDSGTTGADDGSSSSSDGSGTPSPSESVTGDSSGAVPSASSQGGVPSEAEINIMCGFMEIQNCSTRIGQCFKIFGSNAPTPDFSPSSLSSLSEMFECIDLMTQYSEASLKFAESLGLEEVPGSSDISTSTNEGESEGPSIEQIQLMCFFSEDPNCQERVERCLSLMGPDAPVPNLPTPEMVECSLYLESISEQTGSSLKNNGTEAPDSSLKNNVTEAPESSLKNNGTEGTSLKNNGTGVSGSSLENSGTGIANTGNSSSSSGSSTEQSGEQNISELSASNLLAKCQDAEVPNCEEEFERCFELVKPAATPPTNFSKEIFECTAFYQALYKTQHNLNPIPDNLQCTGEKCPTCRNKLNPTEEFKEATFRCMAQVIDRKGTLVMKECMKKDMETLVSTIGTVETQPKIQAAFESCFSKYNFEMIQYCVIVECARIIKE